MEEQQTIVIGADHGGYELKNQLVLFLQQDGYRVVDVGAAQNERVDYPDVAQSVAAKVSRPGYTDGGFSIARSAVGILVCGTGIGVSIAANKINGVRCALCHDHYTALMSREHNNANILALGGRTTGIEVAKDIVRVFIGTRFRGEHHTARIEKLHKLEKYKINLPLGC